MKVEGGCYCKAVRYEVEGEPYMRGQCHCRECQYLTGGHPNAFMVMPAASFRYVKGTAKPFTRTDIPDAVTREFCPECGTQLVTRTPRLPQGVIVKVGAMDDPGQYGTPNVAIFTCDIQPFHVLADGLPAFEKLPPRPGQ